MFASYPDPSTWQASSPAVRRSYSISLRVAVACWALPLVAGVLVFLSWLATEWQWLMAAGIITIEAGCVLFLVGVVALGSYLLVDHPMGRSFGRRLAVCVVTGMLLLSNFPAAFGVIVAVEWVMRRYVVSIHNGSSQTLDDVRIVGAGHDIDVGTIGPRSRATRSMRFSGEGDLKLTARKSGKPIAVVFDDVSNGVGGETTVAIDEDGQLSVKHPKRINLDD